MHSRTLYKIEKYDLPEEEILAKNLFRVFVFGLPRSGTSMMTRICEILGVKMIHTSEEKKHDYAHLGGEYHPNETGFYEITKNILAHYMEIAATPYSGCKMIIPVTNHRLELVLMVPSKVILMWRDPEEIRQSQNAFYANNVDSAYFKTALVTQKLRLKELKIDHLIVEYRNVIQNPREEIQKVKEFIQSDRGIDEAVEFVNPEAYRFNRDKIVEGL